MAADQGLASLTAAIERDKRRRRVQTLCSHDPCSHIGQCTTNVASVKRSCVPLTVSQLSERENGKVESGNADDGEVQSRTQSRPEGKECEFG